MTCLPKRKGVSVSDRLCECNYCGVLRVYEPGKSCPGCGAPLTKGKRAKDWEAVDKRMSAHIRMSQAQTDAFARGQMGIQQQMGMMQSSHYDQMLGMQQSMLSQELAATFGMGRYSSERRGKK